MGEENELNVTLDSRPENEELAAGLVSAYCKTLKLSFEERADVKTAVTEAFRNAAEFAYGDSGGAVEINCRVSGKDLLVSVRDRGCGIADLHTARQPLFTSGDPAKHAGMGFSYMEAFCDEIKVLSKRGEGTMVTFRKHIGKRKDPFLR